MKTEYKKEAIKVQVAKNLLQIITKTKKSLDTQLIEKLKGMAGSNTQPCQCK